MISKNREENAERNLPKVTLIFALLLRIGIVVR